MSVEQDGKATVPISRDELFLRSQLVQDRGVSNSSIIQLLENSLGECRRVIVDVREFRSKLPCVLHSAGFEICPVTLEVL